MAISDFVKTAVHGRLILRDGSGVPVVLNVQYDLGDVAISGLTGKKLNTPQHHQARGRHISTSYGERVYPQLKFSAFLTGEGAATPGSVQAFIMQNTPYTANVSTTGAGRPYAIEAQLVIEGDDFGDAADWDTTFEDCVPVAVDFGEAMDGNKFSFTLDVTGEISGSLTAEEL